MAYSCYIRYEGKGIVEVEPTVTIRFDQLTTITRNRVRRVFEDNYCPYSWSSKPHAILAAMRGHYRVFTSLLVPKIMSHPDFDKDMFAAKALLLGYEFSILGYTNPRAPRNGYGNILYKGYKEYDDRPVEQMEKLTQATLLPIAKSLIDHKKLEPILHAIDNHKPYSFTGVNMR